MKIIGKTQHNLLLEASADEVARLLGHYYPTSAARGALEIGAEVKVNEMWTQMYNLSRAQRELRTASQTLHSIANLMLIADPLIQAVVAPDEGEAKQ